MEAAKPAAEVKKGRFSISSQPSQRPSTEPDPQQPIYVENGGHVPPAEKPNGSMAPPPPQQPQLSNGNGTAPPPKREFSVAPVAAPGAAARQPSPAQQSSQP